MSRPEAGMVPRENLGRVLLCPMKHPQGRDPFPPAAAHNQPIWEGEQVGSATKTPADGGGEPFYPVSYRTVLDVANRSGKCGATDGAVL